ncbi:MULTISPECIES: hypothetical protein [unclassified Streptomyces]|uniref:hypothetical protein n=1 Tax=unclassified Streptomyces TaxID=2593676 RepID=UPI000AB4D662|nr:hypothetical protein [Streptomyces sp. TSRI0281]
MWLITGTDGKPPREPSRYERARVASLTVQNAIRAARSAPAAAHTDDHHDQMSDAPHAVDHPDRDAARTPAQRAAIYAHQQAAMPEEYLEGCTTDPATWMRTPENLDRLAATTRAANARRRAFGDGEIPAPAADPSGPVGRRRQEHEQQHQQPGPGQGQGLQP